MSRQSRQVRAQSARFWDRAAQMDSEAEALTRAAADTDDADTRTAYLALADSDDECARTARNAAASGEHLADLLETPWWRRGW